MTPPDDSPAEETGLPLVAPDQSVLSEGQSRTRTLLRVGIRVAIIVGAILISGFALFNIFEDLEISQIKDALGRLSDAEWLALGFGWLLWVGAQGMQTASLVRGLPVRRGVLAHLGPSAVASVIPGPSDLPLRFSMYQSWGVSNSEAATAVAASGIFSMGSQLALPALAGIAILFADVPLEGFLSVIVITTVVLAISIGAIAFSLGAESRTARMGQILEPVWRFVHRIARKPEPKQSLEDLLVSQRKIAFDHLEGKWLPTTAATVVRISMKLSLLVMSLRFVGIPEEALSPIDIFVVFALVAGLTVIPITPGSAGVSEIALIGMLTPIAGTEYVNEVAAGVLLYRLLTWLLVIPTGFGVLAVWRYEQRKKDAASSSG